MTQSIIPFGKYAGQPVEVVAEADPQYLEWLHKEIGLSRNRVREAIHRGLMIDRVFAIEDLPPDQRKGGKKDYIKVAK